MPDYISHRPGFVYRLGCDPTPAPLSEIRRRFPVFPPSRWRTRPEDLKKVFETEED